MTDDTIEYLLELTEKDCIFCPELAMDRITYAICEIERLNYIIKLLIGFAPVDSQKFIKMLEAWEIEVNREL